MNEQERDLLLVESAGTALAAFTLAQISLWYLVQSGSLSHNDAERMLMEAIGANSKGGAANHLAAKKLQVILDMILKSKAAQN